MTGGPKRDDEDEAARLVRLFYQWRTLILFAAGLVMLATFVGDWQLQAREPSPALLAVAVACLGLAAWTNGRRSS